MRRTMENQLPHVTPRSKYMADINQYLPELRHLLLISHVFYSKVDPVDIEKMSSQPTFASLILENKEFSRGGSSA